MLTLLYGDDNCIDGVVAFVVVDAVFDADNSDSVLVDAVRSVSIDIRCCCCC